MSACPDEINALECVGLRRDKANVLPNSEKTVVIKLLGVSREPRYLQENVPSASTLEQVNAQIHGLRQNIRRQRFKEYVEPTNPRALYAMRNVHR